MKRTLAVWLLIAVSVFIAGCRGMTGNEATAPSPTSPIVAAPTSAPTSIPIPTPTPTPPPTPSPAPLPPPPPVVEKFYWISQENNAGYYSLDVQTGAMSQLQPPVHLPNYIQTIGIEDSLNEVALAPGDGSVGNQVVLAARDTQSGALAIDGPRFPIEDQRHVQTSFVHPNGNYAYVIADGPQDPDTSQYNIYLQIYQRQSSGGFALLSETTIGGGQDFYFPGYFFSGILHVQDAYYLVVNSNVTGHPGTFPRLDLWKLTASGHKVGPGIGVIADASEIADRDIIAGWRDNVFVTSGTSTINDPKQPYYQKSQFVFALQNDRVTQIASCGSLPQTVCPVFYSVAISATHNFAYEITVDRLGYLSLQLTNWDSNSQAMSFSQIPGVFPNFDDKLYIDPSGKYLIMTGSNLKLAHVYRIEGSTGNLTEVAGSPFALTDAMSGLAFLP